LSEDFLAPSQEIGAWSEDLAATGGKNFARSCIFDGVSYGVTVHFSVFILLQNKQLVVG
jgi:hypothetical protein